MSASSAEAVDGVVDGVVVGGGPAGLSAALILGRARKRVVLFDAGTPRNARAEHVNGFVTRDGTPPAELRRIAQEQLAAYPSVELRRAAVRSVTGEKGRFVVASDAGTVTARRVVLCLGMIDELPELPGYRELWARSLFQCPYCHAWEVRDRAFGYIAPAPQWLEFALFLRGWTADVLAFTDGRFEAPPAAVERLARAGIRVETRPIRRLLTRAPSGPGSEQLAAVELVDGTAIPRDVLFVRPPQRQHALVTELGLALDEQGFVRVDPMSETSRPGVYAAGDLTTMKQGALLGAAAGANAAYALNHELTLAMFSPPEAAQDH